MSKRERIYSELEKLPEQELDRVFTVLQLLRDAHNESQPEEPRPSMEEAMAWSNW
jgi:hypothetical protein